MDRTLFERYKASADELDRLVRQDVSVCDVVRGSSPESPYTSHPIKVRGIDLETANWIRERIERLKGEMAVVESAISLAPERTRDVLTLHYVEGLNWAQVQMVLGYSTPDAPRKAAHRYIEEY